MALSDDLDLELAWDKTKINLKRNRKIFVNNPYIRDVIDRDREKHIEHIAQAIDQGYAPSDARIINCPKSNWNTRPARVLEIMDAVVYSSILINLHHDIKDEIGWSAEDRRFSRILLDDLSGGDWMESNVEMWRRWKDRSKELFNEYDYVVVTDINSYFENIEHHILYSNIREVNNDQRLRDLLLKCLQRWHRPKSRGLPQGYYPSNILSELYLNKVDNRLKSEGIYHTRYSDDLNIYCDSKEEAIDALEKLIQLYRKRGLYLNRKKTKILTSDQAQEQFKDPQDIIKKVQSKIGDRLERERERQRNQIQEEKRKHRKSLPPEIKSEDMTVPYADGGQIEYSELSNDGQETVLEATFKNHIEEKEDIDDSLFRNLLRSMGDIKDGYAISYCLDQISDGGPDIRWMVDKYFSKLDNKDDVANKLMEMINRDEIHYEFQKFVIIRWFFQSEIVTNEVLSGMRSLLRENHQIPEVLNYVISYLGKFGNTTDIDEISDMYRNSQTAIRKSVILMATRDIDRELRGIFYSKVKDDHRYCASAAKFAKEISQ